MNLISSSELLKPKTFAAAVLKKKDKQVSLGTLPSSSKKPILDDGKITELRKSDFMFLYTAARLATEERFVDEHYFTTDKKNISFYNFCKNSNPEQVFEAFNCGLISTIYPSHNLMELNNFPKGLKKVVKNFRTKVLKDAEKDIFLKITSTIPLWIEDKQVYQPHHHIHIGVSKGEKYYPSKEMPTNLEEKDLDQLASQKINDYLEKILSFRKEDKIYINYVDDKILVTSSSLKPISQEGERDILTFQTKLMVSNAFGDHNKDICRIIQQKAKKNGRNYSCRFCPALKDEDKDPTPAESLSPSSSSTM